MKLFESNFEHCFYGLQYIVSMDRWPCKSILMYVGCCSSLFHRSECLSLSCHLHGFYHDQVLWTDRTMLFGNPMTAAVLYLFKRKLYISISELLNLLCGNTAIISRRLPSIHLFRIYKHIFGKGILIELPGRACRVLWESIRRFRGYFRGSF